MNWRTKLYLYSGASAGGRKLPLLQAFYIFETKLLQDSPQILSFSVDGAIPSGISANDTENAIRSMASTFAHILTVRPDLIIVVAGGNKRFRGTVATYIRSPGAAIMRAALLLLKTEQPQFSSRIIVVTGTRPGNAFWDVSTVNPSEGSDFFTGMMDIAAPAQEVRLLDRWTNQGLAAVPLRTGSGTSFATPMVAGTAALLLAMDSTLAPDSVKDYILRGAQEPRLNSQTGALLPPQPVQGAPESVQQLDVYGALTLLAREDTTAPICGFPVHMGLGATDYELYFERVPGNPTLVPLTFNSRYPPVSVAQGGRLLAITFGDEGDTVQYVNHRGVKVGGPSAASRHVFLERDTVVVSGDRTGSGAGSRTVTLRRPGGGSPITIDPEVVVFGPETDSTSTFTDLIDFSPAGDWIAATVTRAYLAGGAPPETRWVLIPWTSSPAPVTVKSYSLVPSCTPNRLEISRMHGGTWSHDGRHVIISAARSDNCGPARTAAVLTEIVNGQPQIAPNELIFEGVQWFWPNFTSDDSVLTVSEGNIGVGTCTKAKREFANLSNTIAQSPAPVEDCDELNEGPQIFNSRRSIAEGETPRRRHSARVRERQQE